MLFVGLFVSFFFFKQKTAYEMRISDWSSDVRSSDLAQLVGDLSPDLRCAFLIGLQEDLADRGGDDSVLALGHIGQGIAHEVHPAALPGGAHDAGDRALEALVSIGDDQLNAGTTAPNKVLQEVGPDDLRFRGADMQATDPAPAHGVDGNGD